MSSVLGSTDDCAVAAMGDAARRIYGVQFHPEVTHTEFGAQLLGNFVRRVCGCESTWKPSSAETIEAIKADIRTHVGESKKVLFFVSGGVDSTVAYKLCADALGQDRVHGVYVDTGFMRKNESADVMAAYEKAGFQNVRLRDASVEFLAAVGGETNPETKRKLIGAAVSLGGKRRARPSSARRVAARPGHDLSRHHRVGRHARVGAHQDAPQPCARAAGADCGRGGRRAAGAVLQGRSPRDRPRARAAVAAHREAAISRSRSRRQISVRRRAGGVVAGRKARRSGRAFQARALVYCRFAASVCRATSGPTRIRRC